VSLFAPAFSRVQPGIPSFCEGGILSASGFCPKSDNHCPELFKKNAKKALTGGLSLTKTLAHNVLKGINHAFLHV